MIAEGTIANIEHDCPKTPFHLAFGELIGFIHKFADYAILSTSVINSLLISVLMHGKTQM